MKKQLFTLFILVSFIPMFGQAQQLDDGEMPSPLAIIQTGIGMQFGTEIIQSFSLSIERPYQTYWQIGLQNQIVFQKEEYNSYGFSLQKGYEIGGFAKYFLHGRLSGRKSGFFLGPEFRKGVRTIRFLDQFIFPQPINPEYTYFKEHTTKFLLRWGGQWQFKHAVLEISAPMGAEHIKASEDYYGAEPGTHFVILPTVQLGIAF